MKSAHLLRAAVAPADVHSELGKHILVDGFPMVFDPEASAGAWLVDARTQQRYLDFFSFFASLPLGFNHAAFSRPENRDRLLTAAIHKVSNSDVYTELYASFVKTFAEIALPAGFEHLFFIEGGALAVENALKVAFDWKVRRNLAAGRPHPGRLGSQVLHFRDAFHGRSGYTLSLTNTDPVKTDYFPKFDWPRVSNPKIIFPITPREEERVARAERASIAEIERAFRDRGHDIAAIVIETIQGEGGDHHFRPEFLRALREIADHEEALLIFDEVQCGFGLTGKFWAFEHFGVRPDIVAFGKKSQVCGLMASGRVDDVSDNVFKKPSRINSTWGGNLVDMVRCEIILEVMRDEGLVESAAAVGAAFLDGLREAASPFPDLVTNVRGRGLMAAFDLPSPERRKQFLGYCLEERFIVLPCGRHSVRFRPSLTVGQEEVDEALKILTRVFQKLRA
jgi:L-lysine 6-transaminase